MTLAVAVRTGVPTPLMPTVQPPITIHVHRMAPNYAQPTGAGAYHHGAPEWSEGFGRFISGVLPTVIADARQRKARWWQQPDVLCALRAERPVSETALDGLLAWLRDGRTYKEVSAEYHKGPNWLQRNLRIVERVLDSEEWNVSLRHGI